MASDLARVSGNLSPEIISLDSNFCALFPTLCYFLELSIAFFFFVHTAFGGDYLDRSPSHPNVCDLYGPRQIIHIYTQLSLAQVRAYEKIRSKPIKRENDR